MKVVINECVGGFGISKEALRELYNRKSKAVNASDPSEYYGSKQRAQESIKKEFDAQGNHRYMDQIFIDGKIINDNDNEEGRTDPELIKLIEEWGSDKVSGKCSQLAVVEIPDGIEWTIHEYDGAESVEEKHRSWR